MNQNMTALKDGCSITSYPRKPINDRVRINVSGTMFETLEETLSRFPDTLLGCPTKRVQYFDAKHEEYFFNRNRLAFDAILFYYQSYGRLVRPDVVPENIFIEEVRFFEIRSGYTSTRDKIERALQGKNEDLPRNLIQRKIWLLFSHPESSHAAKVLAVLSVVIILLSVIIPCFESSWSSEDLAVNNDGLFSTLEMACYVWFTFELVVRFTSAPCKLRFFRSALNIVDIISVVPYYVLLSMQGTRAPLSVLRAARMLRVLRIFKLSRYSSGMRILLFTFATSMKELGMFMVFIFISIVVSSSAAFYAEAGCGEKCAFTSIPDAFWWSVNTITTVGYGDQYPLTASGKMVGCLLTVFGVLIIALPVFLFVANFNKVMSANMAAIDKGKKEAS